MKILKNKKGFTLVELLAVIVILALIMSIAIISMNGIMDSAKYSTFKETGLQIINGVRDQLILANELNGNRNFTGSNGQTYYFESKIVEKGGKSSPLGGDILYINTPATENSVLKTALVYGGSTAPVEKIGMMGIYRSETATETCGSTSNSFVRVKRAAGDSNFEYSICLTAGSGHYYLEGTEAELLNNNNTDVVKLDTSTTNNG